MTVSTQQYLKSFHDATKAMGEKAVSSDFAFEIEGFEANWLLCKQAPLAQLSPAGEIEVPTALGSTIWQAQQIKTAQQGQITLMETVAGSIDDLLLNLITGGAYFNAKMYEGTPDKFIRAKRYERCFIQLDNADRDWENRSQVLMFNGTLFYHYYGEIIPGNSADYR